MANPLIQIEPPIPGSKIQRRWSAVVGGYAFNGDSEEEVRKKAVEFCKADPLIQRELDAAFDRGITHTVECMTRYLVEERYKGKTPPNNQAIQEEG